MKQTVIYGALIISCTAQTAYGVQAGNIITHDTCKITLSEGMDKKMASAKGFLPSTYIFKYQTNGEGPVLSQELPTDNDKLIHRSNSLDRGEAELQAKLSSLHFGGIPTLKIISDQGDIQEFGKISLEGSDVKFSDTTPIRAALYNVLSTYSLDKMNNDWIFLKTTPQSESLALSTEEFTLQGLAQELLQTDPEDSALQIIAGQKSLAELKAAGISIDEKTVNEIRYALVLHKLSQTSERPLNEVIMTSLPACVTQK